MRCRVSKDCLEETIMKKDAVAIARACYEAYVTKDQAAIEALLAEDFHFTSPLDNRLDRATYFRAAGRTAKRQRGLISSTSSPTGIGCSSPMRDVLKVVAFAIRRS